MKISKLTIFIMGLVGLSGCDTMRETFGLHRSQPDEFNVIDRHPLTVPPGYELYPPKDGQVNPAIVDPHAQAQQSVFGHRENIEKLVRTQQKVSKGEQALLSNLSSDSSRQNIRKIILNEQKNSEDTVNDRMKSLSRTYKNNSDLIDPQAEYRKHTGQSHPSDMTNRDLVNPNMVDERQEDFSDLVQQDNLSRLEK